MLSRAGFFVGLLLTLSTGSALAETDFPVIGGPGNGPFEDRCPPGKYLQGFTGFAGAWVNQIQIVCVKVVRASTTMQDGYLGQPYHGPPRGEFGEGGAVTVLCTRGQVITGIQPLMTDGNRQVKFMALSCGDGDGRYDDRPLFVGPHDNAAKDVNLGPDHPQNQLCPDGEAGVGVRGRYGMDLNAISLICFNFDTPETLTPAPPGVDDQIFKAAQAMFPGDATARVAPPPVSNSGMPIKVTGAGGAPPRDLQPRQFRDRSSAGERREDGGRAERQPRRKRRRPWAPSRPDSCTADVESKRTKPHRLAQPYPQQRWQFAHGLRHALGLRRDPASDPDDGHALDMGRMMGC